MMARTGARSGTVTATSGLRSSQIILRPKKKKQETRNQQGPCVMRWRFTDNGEAGKRGTTLTAEATIDLHAQRIRVWLLDHLSISSNLTHNWL